MCSFLPFIDSADIANYIEITQSVMSKPVYLLTVGGSQGVQLLDRSNMGQI